MFHGFHVVPTVLAAVAFQAKPPASAADASLRGSGVALALAATIELPGVEGRIDHLTIDLARRRLFVAAFGNNSLEVVDLDTKKRWKSLGGLAEPQGVLCGELAVFHAGTLEPVAKVKVGADADNVRCDPRTKLVYVGYGDGGLAIVDAKTWKVVGDVALAGHPESFQFDAKTGRAFVNVPSKREIAVVDLETRKVVETWPVKEAESNFPMEIQGADRRLFVACRKPARLLVLDPSNGRTFDALALSGDADDVFLDEASGRLFVSCGEGSIDVFERGVKGAYAPAGKVETAAGARTCLYWPAEEKLFLAVPHRGDHGAEIRVYDARR